MCVVEAELSSFYSNPRQQMPEKVERCQMPVGIDTSLGTVDVTRVILYFLSNSSSALLVVNIYGKHVFFPLLAEYLHLVKQDEWFPVSLASNYAY